MSHAIYEFSNLAILSIEKYITTGISSEHIIDTFADTKRKIALKVYK